MTITEQRDALREAAGELLEAMREVSHAHPHEKHDAQWDCGRAVTKLEEVIRKVDDEQLINQGDL